MTDLMGGDPDQMLAYHTQMQVNILDSRLGLMNTVLQIGVAVYVAYDLYFNEGYYQYEASRGVAITHNSGDAYVASKGKPGHRYFSADEIGIPGLENGNRFVATKITVRKQKRSVCEDPEKKCKSNSDCSFQVGGVCTPNGVCEEPSWCNVADPANPMGTEIYDIPSSEHLIWVKSAIQYLQIAPDRLVHSEMTKPIRYPADNFNMFTLKDILDLCYPKVHFEEVSQLGAAIEVQFIYDCVVNSKLEHCRPRVSARRLDSLFVTPEFQDIGFGFNKAYYFADGQERELLEVRGIRLYFRAVGTGREISPIVLMMRFSTGLALLGIATVLTDVIMLRFMSLKAKYFARKYLESEDFSCLEDFEREEQQRRKEKEKKKSEPGMGDDEGWLASVGKMLHPGKDTYDADDASEDDAEAEWRQKVDEAES